MDEENSQTDSSAQQPVTQPATAPQAPSTSAAPPQATPPETPSAPAPAAPAATPPVAPAPTPPTQAPAAPASAPTPPVATPAPPTTPTPAATPPQPGATQPQAASTTFNFDPRTKLTIQWSAIWYAVAAIIENVATHLSFSFIGGIAGEFFRTFGGLFSTFSFSSLIKDIIWGLVIGAIGGFILSKFYPKIQELNRKWLKGKLNTMFKLLFYPSLVGAILGFLAASTAAFAIGIVPIIIISGGIVAGSFVYAKMLSKKVASQYEPPA